MLNLKTSQSEYTWILHWVSLIRTRNNFFIFVQLHAFEISIIFAINSGSLFCTLDNDFGYQHRDMLTVLVLVSSSIMIHGMVKFYYLAEYKASANIAFSMFGCLSVCRHDNFQACWPISLKFSMRVNMVKGKCPDTRGIKKSLHRS